MLGIPHHRHHIYDNMANVDEKFRDELLKRIERIKQGERDLYF